MKISYLVTSICAVMPLPAVAEVQQHAPEPTQMKSQDTPAEPTFSGFKIGADTDWRRTTVHYDLPLLSSVIDRRKDGIGYSLHLGYDNQVGQSFVIGSEVAIGRSDTNLSADEALGVYTLKPRWSLDVSSRAGYLVEPQILLYGRVGYSLLRVREKTDLRAVTTSDVKAKGTENGFLFGGGIETAVYSGLFLRAEYNKIDYGNGLTTSKVLFGINAGF